MKKTNFKKIMSRYNGSYIWWGILILCLTLMLVAFFLQGAYPYEFIVYMLTALIICLPLMLIGILTASLIRRARLKRMIQKQGPLESFNSEEFLEIGYSRHFYVSPNWLIWNRGFEYRILHRSQILGAAVHPGQREGNAYGVLDLYTSQTYAPMNLYYLKNKEVDLPAMIHGWLQMNAPVNPYMNPVVQPMMNPTAMICPACHAPAAPGDRFCAYCGTQLM